MDSTRRMVPTHVDRFCPLFRHVATIAYWFVTSIIARTLG